MTAAALPIALVFGIAVELVSGLLTRVLGGDRVWWRPVSGVGTQLLGLVRDRSGRERVALIEAGGAAAALLGSGLVAAGALGVGPGDLPLLYLSLAAASAGGMVAGSVPVTAAGRERAHRFRAALAEPAVAVALGAMFLRYGTMELDSVRGTQEVLGTGLLLGPGLAVAGLASAALAFLVAGALRLPRLTTTPTSGRARGSGAGVSLLLRLCRWSLAGSSSLVAGVLLAGGSLQPFAVEGSVPVLAAAFGVAVAMGVADAFLARLSEGWRLAACGLVLLVAAAAVAMVVLA